MAPIAENSSRLDSSSTNIDPKTTARRIFNGDVKDLQKMSIADQIEMSAPVRFARDRLEKIEEKIDANVAKISAYEALRAKLQKVREATKYLKTPINSAESALNSKKASISTTDNPSTDYISINVSPGAAKRSFSVNVQQLATNNVITLGTADLTNVTAAYNDIQAAADINTALIAATKAPLEDGIPTNPYIKSFYLLAYTAKESGSLDLPGLKIKVTELYTEMLKKPVSAGFAALDTACVDNNAASTIQSGTYSLFSMAGGTALAKAMNIAFHDSNIVLNTINALTTPPLPANPTVLEIQTAMDAVQASFLGGYDAGTHLPLQGTLGIDIANAAYTAANGAATLDDIKAAAADTANTVAIDSFLNTLKGSFPEGSDISHNSFLKAITKAAVTAQNKVGATLESIATAIDSAYTEYVENCTVTFENGDSVQTVIDKINATTDYSGVEASAIQNGDGSFLIELRSINTGIDFIVNILDPSDITTDKIAVLSNNTININEFPSNALAIIDGRVMQQNSNIFDEVFEGVSIELKVPNNNILNKQTVTIQQDNSEVEEAIALFISAYNELALFIAQQSQINPTTHLPTKDSVLAKDDYLTRMKSMLPRILTTALGFTDEGYNSLQALGINLTDVNADPEHNVPFHQSLSVNIEKLRTAIKTNFEQVKRIFEFSFVSSTPNLKVIGDGALRMGATNLKVTIHRAASDLGPDNKQAKIDIVDSLGNITATEYFMLEGPDGTGSYKIDLNRSLDKANPNYEAITNSKLKGLILSFNSAADPAGPIDLTYRQGVADALHNYINEYADDLSQAQIGLLTKAQETMIKISESTSREKKYVEEALSKAQQRVLSKINSANQRAQQARLDSDIMTAWLDMQNGN